MGSLRLSPKIPLQRPTTPLVVPFVSQLQQLQSLVLLFPPRLWFKTDFQFFTWWPLRKHFLLFEISNLTNPPVLVWRVQFAARARFESESKLTKVRFFVLQKLSLYALSFHSSWYFSVFILASVLSELLRVAGLLTLARFAAFQMRTSCCFPSLFWVICEVFLLSAFLVPSARTNFLWYY
jgi:hypothetical protein